MRNMITANYYITEYLQRLEREVYDAA